MCPGTSRLSSQAVPAIAPRNSRPDATLSRWVACHVYMVTQHACGAVVRRASAPRFPPLIYRLLDVLDTTVRLELLARALPVERALDELVDDSDHIVNLANKLRGRVTLAERDCAVLECWPSVSKQHEAQGTGAQGDARNNPKCGYSLAKSTVQPNGVPSSSLRAYFLPIDAPESSTRDAMPYLRSLRADVSAPLSDEAY